MIIKTDDYICYFCGKQNVKLWRPHMETFPLICAECAENRQTPCEYEEVVWKKEGNGRYIGEFTGRRIPIPKWKVDENGEIPSYDGPGPEGEPMQMTDQPIVDLSDVLNTYLSNSSSMIPAFPDGNGNYLDYKSVPEELFKWWRKLPTKQSL